MKEIDINIEGYNVNGICVGCLNYNRNMYYRNEIKECFKLLADIDVPDGLSIQVCWECLAAVKNVQKFKKQILKSYDILINYSRKHPFLNSPHDLSQHAVTNLSQSTLVGHTNRHGSSPLEDVKQELTFKVEGVEQVKEELYDIDVFRDTFVKDEDTFDLGVLDTQSSDDNTLLSELVREDGDGKSKKERKEKREKRKKDKIKTKSRRLKNLPEDLVELYSMTEEEMHSVRERDVASAEFASLKHKCSDCVRGFNTRKLLEGHLTGKHSPKEAKSFQCEVCKGFFINKENLSVHKNQHLKAFRCRECGLITTLKRIMVRHECAKRKEDYSCTECDKTFNSKSKLTYHKNVSHEEKPQCDCCGKVFANKMTLKYHLKILPAKKEDKPKEMLYIPCKGCDKVFHSQKSYRAHVVIHDGLTYPCPICGKLFQWKRNLARHARNHRERETGTTHQCRECGKTFSSRDCYNNHMKLSKRHVPESALLHACHYCDKRFATKWCMVDHIDWDHLKQIKYRCSVCFKPFKTAKIMVAHMNNIHEGKNKKELEEEHLCEICGKSYKTEKRLKGHVWAMHTKRSNTKSFKCSLCPATFTWQTSIYKHMRMMHDNKRKQPRAIPTKKEEPYVEIELTNPMPYFQQNINLNPSLQPINIVQNIG
ncbi:zinc finger protein 676-like [Zerene cesonia]|uniref:zinc finger protein 676-like n=1 Tax=Zerene cesonia TaxID=33412 RepID=UPI0018E5A8E3|nr:zinc finger protein 676-like [Zerene cesonia]